MPRKTQRPDNTPSAPMQRFVWNLHTGSDIAEIAHWDLKPELLIGAVLEVLAAGDKIQFSRRSWNHEIVIAIYGEKDGDRAYFTARDAVELDDQLAQIYGMGKQMREDRENAARRNVPTPDPQA